MIDLIKKQQSVWESLKNSGKPVVLYGMGDGADKVLKAFEKFNIQTAGVMASDEFVRGQSFHGFKVKKLSELEAELGDFTVALCFASQLPDVMAAIKNVAQRHKTLVPSVPVFGDILFDEKISGSIHFTPGMCYDDAPNGNKSAIHWDLVLIMTPEYGGGEIWFDDVLIRKDGRFVIPELECLNPENLM